MALEIYRRRCAELKVRPNSGLLKMLPTEGCEIVNLDLTDNMVGNAGLSALLEVIRQAPKLQQLCFKANNLTDPPVKELAKTLKSASHLTLLDLRSNDIRLAAAELLDLLKTNRCIEEMLLDDTSIRPFYKRRIAVQLNKNRSARAAPSAAPPASPPADPATEGPDPEVIPAELRRYSAFEAAEDSPPAEEEAFGFKPGSFSPKEAQIQQTDEQATLTKQLGDFSFETSPKAGGKPQAGFSAPEEPASGPGLGSDLKKVVGRRPTVCAEVITTKELDEFKPEKIAKDEKDRAFLLMVLERNLMFNHLDDRELLVAVDAMQPAMRAAGDNIYEQDDEGWDLFYILISGEVSVSIDSEVVKDVKKGGWFGEMALLYPQTAPETAKADRESQLYSLDRMTYKFILSQASQNRRQLYGKFLQKVPFLQSLSEAEVLQLADALKSSTYDDKAPLITYGEEGDWFHIVVEGTVEVIGREAGEKVKVCDFKEGDCVGELEFINNHQTVADVLAVGPVRTAKMNRRHFEMCMGPVLDLLKKNAASLEKFAYYRETLSKLKGD